MVELSSICSECESDRPAEVGPIETVPAAVPAQLSADRPDAHWIAIADEGRSVERCSLWWSDTPSCSKGRIGYIGHFAAECAEAANSLLRQACAQLGLRRCTMAVGPVDGSNLRNYRFVTHHGNEPRFFLEPDNPPEWPNHFRDEGFTVFGQYTSALDSNLDRPFPREEWAAKRLSHLRIRIRSLDVRHIEHELVRVYSLVVSSFRQSPLYHPFCQEEFIQRYLMLLPLIQPDLVLLAENDNELVGFAFGIPDHAQRERGEAIDTIIIRTLAISRSRNFCGLGRLLLSEHRKIAKSLGYTRSIHAMMHDHSRSRGRSARCAQTFRHYAVFSRTLIQ